LFRRSSTVAIIACCTLAPQPGFGQSTPRTAIRDSIPGTLVTFEMVYVPAPAKGLAATAAIKPFYIGRTEVSWDMYDVYMHKLDAKRTTPAADAVARPSMPYAVPDYDWGHAGFAAMSITFQAAQRFAEWLSAKTGHKYRLPTEAEWVHAATLAAGTTPLTRVRIDAMAWHSANAEGTTHAMASKKADALGLFDMFGNVTEWVVTGEPIAVTRGGSFRDDPAKLGPQLRLPQKREWTERDPQLPSSRWWLTDGPFVGFRLVRDP
jgi:formylglycine-generating enzyme required for sulfatase activity